MKIQKVISDFLIILSIASISLLSFAETSMSPSQPEPATQGTTETVKQDKVDTNSTKDAGSSAKTLAMTIVTTIMPTVSSKLTSGDTSKKEKLVLKAKDDAAAYVATNGQVKGVYLNAVLAELRKEIPQSKVTDAQLAESILAW